MLRDFAEISANRANSPCFLAYTEENGDAVAAAAGALSIHKGVALFSGCCNRAGVPPTWPAIGAPRRKAPLQLRRRMQGRNDCRRKLEVSHSVTLNAGASASRIPAPSGSWADRMKFRSHRERKQVPYSGKGGFAWLWDSINASFVEKERRPMRWSDGERTMRSAASRDSAAMSSQHWEL